MPIDLFDTIELSLEDRFSVSDKFRNLLQDQIIKSDSLQKLIRKMVDKEKEQIIKSDYFHNIIRQKIVKEMEKSDIFDDIELSEKDKILMSDNDELKNLFMEITKKEIAKMPIVDMLSTLKEEFSRNISDMASRLEKKITESDLSIKSKVKILNEDIDKSLEKMQRKYDDLKTQMISFEKTPRYEFGGFSPQFNDLNIGDPSTEGSWRIVTSGSDLSVERLESGTWVQKGAFNP